MSVSKKKTTIKEIKFNRVRVKKDGSTDKVASIKHIQDGKDRQDDIPNFILKANQELLSKIKKLKAGDDVVLVKEKKGSFWNIVDIVQDVAGIAMDSSSKNDYSIGMQVGNALNNAALLMAHGVMKGDLEAVAREVIRVGDRLKASLKGDAVVEEPAMPTKTETVTVDDDDIEVSENLIVEDDVDLGDDLELE